MIRAIVMDCYGTLIDTGSGSLAAVEQILTKNHSRANPEAFYRHWKDVHRKLCCTEPFRPEAEHFRKGLKETYRAFAVDGIPEEDVHIYLATWGNRIVFPEVLAVLDKLSIHFALAVGSNSDHAPLVNDLSRNKIHIPSVYSSERLKSYKPDQLFFRKILDRLQLTSDEIVYIGDSQIEDIWAPARLGIKSIWVNRKRDRLHDGIPRPYMACSDLSGVLDIIR